MRILIAEDDRASRRLIVHTFVRWQYDVIVASDGVEAWGALQAQDAPSLAIIDWMMPGMDGVEVCRRARAVAELRPLYVILLTAKTRREDLIEALDAGADDYVTKPFDPAELQARVRVGVRALELQTRLLQRERELASTRRVVDEGTAALSASEARLRVIVDTAKDAIVTIDAHGAIHEFNPAAEEMFGWRREEVVGRDLADLIVPERHREAHRQELRRYHACKESPVLRRAVELSACRRSGEEFPVELSIGAAGTTAGTMFIAVIRDVSERNRLEVERRHGQKLESVGRLAAGIAHEINTPIQFVSDNTRFLGDAFASLCQLTTYYRRLRESATRGQVEAALLEEIARAEEGADLPYLHDEIPKAIGQSLEGIERVASIVRAMKQFAHPDASDKSSADLNQALVSTLTVARNELKYVAEVETDLGDLPPVYCHIGDLNQVFLNLLINAAHAIADVTGADGPKGRIRVRTAHEGDTVLIAISDTGGGIREDIRARIFDPFFTTKEVGRGTGQGLAIARSIVVEKHGGSLTVESEVGRGTTFFIRLPVGAAAPAAAVGAAA